MILYTVRKNTPFQIDDDDYEVTSYFPWYTGEYPVTSIRIVKGKWKTVAIHDFLLGQAPKGFQWDHRNRDKFDNRRKNLRLTTWIGNRRNRDIARNNTSGATGVYKAKNGRWKASIVCNFKSLCLGVYDTVEEASAVRKEAENLYWKDGQVLPDPKRPCSERTREKIRQKHIELRKAKNKVAL